MPDPVTTEEHNEIGVALRAMNLVDHAGAFAAERLSGGVSCDVYRVVTAQKTICLKRALPKLRVKADWHAPPERSSNEVAWISLAGRIVPGSVPTVLGEDPARHMFAMEFFPPETFPVWRSLLAEGCIEPTFADSVGRMIARIHAATAGCPKISGAFANGVQFLALRLDPFLRHVAGKHPDVAHELHALADKIAASHIALMHGDVSPKNILCGPQGPVFLDAETACYGDPAFDLAYCLNHLLLKCVWHPEWAKNYVSCFAALNASYLAQVDWEEPENVVRRAAHLLPALLLARIDGKSPVEYLTDERKRNIVREAAKFMLKEYPGTFEAIIAYWPHMVEREFLYRRAAEGFVGKTGCAGNKTFLQNAAVHT